jgi:hypothetical protein
MKIESISRLTDKHEKVGRRSPWEFYGRGYKLLLHPPITVYGYKLKFNRT